MISYTITFKMAAMTSFHVLPPLTSAYACSSVRRLPAIPPTAFDFTSCALVHS